MDQCSCILLVRGILITRRFLLKVLIPDIVSVTLLDLFSFLNIFGDDLLRSTIALFVVINPIGTIPLFASITQKIAKKRT